MNTRSTPSRLALLGSTLLLVGVVTAPVEAQRPRGNADTVDGKHAVGAGAAPRARKGKLVATDRRGLLPNNIIKKAPDANRLDGKDSTAFATKQQPVVFVSDVMKGADRILALSATPTVVLDVPIQTGDQCGGGQTVHRYHVEFTGWLLGGANAFMEGSMAIDTVAGHSFGEGTVVGSGYNAVASSRELRLPPGAHTVSFVASKSGADGLSLADGFLGVTNVGYDCTGLLRAPAARRGAGPAGT